MYVMEHIKHASYTVCYGNIIIGCNNLHVSAWYSFLFWTLVLMQ